MTKVGLLRQAEVDCAGILALAFDFLERQKPRYPHAAIEAIALLRYKVRQHPADTHFQVQRDSFVRLYTPAPPSAPTTRMPRSDSRFLDADATHDSRIIIRTARGRCGPRHTFTPISSIIRHSYAAAYLQLERAS